MGLPANVGFGRVTGRLIRAILDGPSDADTDPDGVPIEGAKVTFTASVNRVVNRTATPPVSIFIDPVTVVTNSDGILVSPNGTEGVTLVASDDADLDPSGWTYKVTMAAPSISTLSWSFVMPEGETLDLATMVPVPTAPGVEVSRWLAAVTDVFAARDTALEQIAAAVAAIPDKPETPVDATVAPFIVDGSLATGSSWAVGAPATYEQGDWIVIAIRVQQAGTDDIAFGGFERLGPALVADSTQARRVGFFRKLATANEPETYALTASNGGRISWVSFTVRGTDLTVAGFAPEYEGLALAGGRSASAVDAGGLALTLSANECTYGNPSRPTSTPGDYAELGFASTSLETTSSRTSLWVGANTFEDTAPQADYLWSNQAGTVAHTIVIGNKSETVTPVSSLLAQSDTFYVAHRCGGANYPEFSPQGTLAAVARGYQAFEISTTRCATGEFVCAHDWDTKGGTGQSIPIWSASWDTLKTVPTLVPSGTNMSPASDAVPSTLQKLEDLLALIPEDRVVFIDHKPTSGGAGSETDQANVIALLDLMDTYPNARERFVWKSFKGGYAASAQARARGYRCWGIYYGDEISTEPTYTDSFDLLGMVHYDTQAEWDTALTAGKKVIAHIIYNSTQRDNALTKGASGIMNSNVLAMP